MLHVAEVKSLTEQNETVQLRLGLGQVLHYRHELESLCPGRTVRPLLVVARRPTGSAWPGLCERLGIVLSWPPDFPGVLPPRRG